MPENIGSTYNTQIPSIADNADIQTAFRLYHYGSNTGTPSSIPEESIAGYLSDLENTKISIIPGTISASADLNTITDTGFYTQTSTPTGSNYPSNFPGMLTVVNSGILKTEADGDGNNFNDKQEVGVIFQQYQVVGAPESGSAVSTLNRTHWRFYFAGAWRPWRTFIEQSDFATIGDARYYTKTEASGIFTTQAAAAATYLTISSADSRQYVAENLVTESYTLALSDTSKVVAVNNSADATITIPLNTSVAFPIGTLINIYSMTANRVTVAPATGVTLRPVGSSSSIYLFDQYTEISLRKRATNEWVASGNFLET
jgi:hypothetical protein